MIKTISGLLLAAFIYIGTTFTDRPITAEYEISVVEILEQKGEDYSAKRPNTSIKGVSANVGKQLFHEGITTKPNGGKTSRQSKHFVCSSCHNTEREDPNLAISDPDARLLYTNERNLPFLQGTTMYGAVNRATYYNGDYDKKYGDLVLPAREDIREAIQLCATECAQGRALKPWELESILAYLWTLEYKVSDLEIDTAAIDVLTIEEIKSKYVAGSPATFIPPPADRKMGSGLTGNPDNGALIYDNSCLHCHYKGRYAFYDLDDHKLSYRQLNKNIKKYSRKSIYQVTRWGVPTKHGKTSYMPQYPKERMSEQQLADLRAFIEMKANS